VAADDGSNEDDADIEAEIKKELADIRKPSTKPLFTSVKLDTQCRKQVNAHVRIRAKIRAVMFFRTRSPIEPVSFVEKICQDTAAGVQIQNCRYVKRLTPITACEKATTKGLESVAKQVLAPHFHGSDKEGKKVSVLIPITRSVRDAQMAHLVFVGAFADALRR